METYTLYTGPGGEIVAVKKGFSWPPFFFGPFWAFSKGLAGMGLGLLVLGILIGYTVHRVPAESSVGLMLVLRISLLILPVIMGFEGNGFWRRRLERKGYQPSGEIQAPDVSAAIYYFQNPQAGVEGPADFLECPRCHALIPPGEPKCPRCGSE
jgi:hypothetical protein